MAAQTVLFDFTVDPIRTSDPKERQEMAKVLRHELEHIFPQIQCQYLMDMDDGYFAVLAENKETIVTVRIFGQGLVTINVEYYLEDGKEQLMSFDVRFCCSFVPGKNVIYYVKIFFAFLFLWYLFVYLHELLVLFVTSFFV